MMHRVRYIGHDAFHGFQGGIVPSKSEGKAQWRHYGHIMSPAVDDYLYDLLPPRHEVLVHMEEEAAKRNIPIVGPVVASILAQLATMIGAKTVFEMGSAIGYSTIWWAQAVGPHGHVHYTDGDKKNAQEAKGYFQKAGVADRITVHVGDALELISEQKQEFDIVFNDIDKDDYPRVIKLALPRLRKGGLFVTDNVLWSGRVTEKNPSDPKTKAVQEFNQKLYASKEFFTTILPVRDGVAVAVKR
jgi:predicted O-methyltransferase YrrM